MRKWVVGTWDPTTPARSGQLATLVHSTAFASDEEPEAVQKELKAMDGIVIPEDWAEQYADTEEDEEEDEEEEEQPAALSRSGRPLKPVQDFWVVTDKATDKAAGKRPMPPPPPAARPAAKQPRRIEPTPVARSEAGPSSSTTELCAICNEVPAAAQSNWKPCFGQHRCSKCGMYWKRTGHERPSDTHRGRNQWPMRR